MTFLPSKTKRVERHIYKTNKQEENVSSKMKKEITTAACLVKIFGKQDSRF